MRKYFKTEQLIPCYSEEGRCKWCRSPLQVWSPTLHKAIGNAWALADDLLEPTRERYGKPIRVKRCFMCYNKCKKLGLDEAYMRGEVVDITAVAGMPRRYKKTDPRYKKSQVAGGQPEVTREEITYKNMETDLDNGQYNEEAKPLFDEANALLWEDLRPLMEAGSRYSS